MWYLIVIWEGIDPLCITSILLSTMMFVVGFSIWLPRCVELVKYKCNGKRDVTEIEMTGDGSSSVDSIVTGTSPYSENIAPYGGFTI